MQLRSAFLTMAMAAGFLSGACSSSTNEPSGTGGSSSGAAGAAGSSSTGTGGACPNGTACGGSVVGTWTVSSSCLTLSATNLDISAAGLESRHVHERQAQGLHQRERNVDRQRQRDVHGRYDHVRDHDGRIFRLAA